MCLQFPIWKTSHTVKWEGVWRELGCLARTASFAVRQESGHSLKSSLSVRASLCETVCTGCCSRVAPWEVAFANMGRLTGVPGWVGRWCALPLDSWAPVVMFEMALV